MSIVVRRAAARSDRAAARLATRKALGALRALPLSDISLSISHKNGRALAAAARSHVSLGVDLECTSAIDPMHARYFLSPRERTARNATALTTMWVLKEAAWKALRCSSDMPLTALELAFDDRGGVRGVILCGVPHRARARLWTPWPGYIAALVVMRSSSEQRRSMSLASFRMTEGRRQRGVG